MTAAPHRRPRPRPVNTPPDGSQLDNDGLDELWRPASAFVGPMMPPMVAWLKAGRPRSAWEVAADARHAAQVVAVEQLAFDFGGAA
jgi:hypothetical protein